MEKKHQLDVGTSSAIRARTGCGCLFKSRFLLTPTAGGKPIAIYTDGWEYHRGRLAKDAEQRMALHRSANYLFWALTWDDVVEKLPSPQNTLQPNGLLQVRKKFLKVKEYLINGSLILF